jgi:predicted phosphodiesterase
MRIGIIADIHANLVALRTVLDALAAKGVDSIVCLGDLVGYGPQPNEVISAIAARDIPTVIGNHDLVAAGRDDVERAGLGARRTLEWTRAELTDGSRSFLMGLPTQLPLGDGVLAAHGSLNDPWHYTRRTRDALGQLEGWGKTNPNGILMLGHTHRQMAIDVAGGNVLTSEWVLARRTRELTFRSAAFVNPGSVGQSREPRALARFALLDLETRTLHLHALRYPVDECKRELVARGLPPEWCHPRPTAKKTIRQVLRDREDRRADVRAIVAGGA